MTDSPPEPDRWCLAIVQQWLAEQGFTRALAALEQEAGLKVQHEVQRGSQLLQLVYDHIEQLAAETVDEAATARRLLEEQLLAGGSTSGPGDCPRVLRASLDEPHASANVIAVQCWPQRRLAVSGSSDGSVRLIGYDGTLVWEAQAGRSGVLCLALHLASSATSSSPHASGDTSGSSGSSLVAAGLMDGSVVVLDAGTGGILARSAPHRKYVVDARWAPGGRHLITASWDCSFAVHRLQRRQAAGGQAAAVEAEAGSSTDCGCLEGGEWELVMVHHEQTPAKVNALELLPPLPNTVSGGNGSGEGGSGGASCRFLVAVQGSNYLREISIRTAASSESPGLGGPSSSSSSNAPIGGAAAAGGAAAGGAAASGGAAAGGAAAGSPGDTVVEEERRINLNPAGDDHVSFSAAHLAMSPCARLLLVSADNGRLLVYERVGWTQLRSIIGLPVEQFHQYTAAWHQSGQYIMAAAAHGGVCLFHVGSARRVATLAAHSKNVRGLAYDAPNNLLLTCSFDRTVKVWEAAGAAECGAGPHEGPDRGAQAGTA